MSDSCPPPVALLHQTSLVHRPLLCLPLSLPIPVLRPLFCLFATNDLHPACALLCHLRHFFFIPGFWCIVSIFYFLRLTLHPTALCRVCRRCTTLSPTFITSPLPTKRKEKERKEGQKKPLRLVRPDQFSCEKRVQNERNSVRRADQHGRARNLTHTRFANHHVAHGHEHAMRNLLVTQGASHAAESLRALHHQQLPGDQLRPAC